MTDDLVGRQTVHVRDNLDAYYYGFDPTGNADVDRILGAIAYAGKAYHHTEDWDDASVIGVSCVGNIQNAAALAAARIEALEAENRVLRGGLDRIAQRDPGNIVRNDEDCERHTLWNIARYTIADVDRLRVAQHLKQENAK